MITTSDIEEYLTRPESADKADKAELVRLIRLYPYCEPLRWVYLRCLFATNDMAFENELQQHGVYISDRKSLYYYITYSAEKEKSGNSISDEMVLTTSVNYYEMTENSATQQSLQQLAERLRAARLARQAELEKSETTASLTGSQKKMNISTIKGGKTLTEATSGEYYSEETAREMIEKQKYSEALEILRSINLNNPKKSVYFALQIKYVETIINNQNKTT